MKLFLKIGSYLFHPLWMPFIGTLFYFLITPEFFPTSIIEAKLFAVLILGLFVPLIFIFLLKNTKLIDSVTLKRLKDRRLVLFFVGLLLLTINNFIIKNEIAELSQFYQGLLISIGLSFLLTYLKYKTSLHIVGLSAFLGFCIALLMLYNLRIVFLIAFITMGLGWVGSSRLSMTNHRFGELITGFVIGFLPQILYVIVIYIRYRI